MCARRFLWVMFFLTLLAVGAAFAIFQLGGRVLLSNAVPQGHFRPPPRHEGPDYAAMSSWLTRPDMQRPGRDGPDDPAQWKPAGAPLPESGDRIAALFYIHPTTYLAKDRWNAPLDTGAGDTSFRTNLFLQSQASAFTDVARPWAPRYRQAAFGAFLLKSEDAQKALDLAYSDVAAAFDRFLQENPSGPIILAGHSQGALHLERLLQEKVAGKPVAKRIVAAYVVGWPISTTADLPRMGLPACSAPDQPGCILSWMSFAEPANPNLILDEWKKTRGLNGGERRQEDLLCVNPLTGTRNGAAPAGQNAGTLVPSGDLKSATLERGLVGAHCNKGLLMVDGTIPSLGPFVLPGNNYHVYDYALFWGAIRGDAWRRTQAWRQ